MGGVHSLTENSVNFFFFFFNPSLITIKCYVGLRLSLGFDN